MIDVSASEPQADEFLVVLQNNRKLLSNVKIAYLSMLDGVFKNVTKITLSDGESLVINS